MNRILIALALLMLTSVAFAVPSSTFTATAPTQYEDGTDIPAEDVLTYRVYCGPSSGNYTVFYDVDSIESGTVIDIGTCVQGQVGTYYFTATALSTVHSSESQDSNEVIRTYIITDIPKTPNAPTLFTVG